MEECSECGKKCDLIFVVNIDGEISNPCSDCLIETYSSEHLEELKQAIKRKEAYKPLFIESTKAPWDEIVERKTKIMADVSPVTEYVKGEAKCEQCRLCLQVEKWVTISQEEYEELKKKAGMWDASQMMTLAILHGTATFESINPEELDKTTRKKVQNEMAKAVAGALKSGAVKITRADALDDLPDFLFKELNTRAIESDYITGKPDEIRRVLNKFWEGKNERTKVLYPCLPQGNNRIPLLLPSNELGVFKRYGEERGRVSRTFLPDI